MKKCIVCLLATVFTLTAAYFIFGMDYDKDAVDEVSVLSAPNITIIEENNMSDVTRAIDDLTSKVDNISVVEEQTPIYEEINIYDPDLKYIYRPMNITIPGNSKETIPIYCSEGLVVNIEVEGNEPFEARIIDYPNTYFYRYPAIHIMNYSVETFDVHQTRGLLVLETTKTTDFNITFKILP